MSFIHRVHFLVGDIIQSCNSALSKSNGAEGGGGRMLSGVEIRRMRERSIESSGRGQGGRGGRRDGKNWQEPGYSMP